MMEPRGLLELYKNVHKKVHLQDFAGQRVAVDGDAWLQQGAMICAQELAINQPTKAYISYFMRKISLLQHYKVIPVIVFHGDALPIKKHINEQNETQRQEARVEGYEHFRNGRLEQAKTCFQKAVEITAYMKKQISKVLDINRITYIHSPFETESQLALFGKKGLVSAVISENANLLVLGCPNILFKLNHDTGDALQMNHKDMFTHLGQGLDFSTWDEVKLRYWLILSGSTDYLPAISGVGLKMAYRYMRHYKSANNVINFLRKKGKIVDPLFEIAFERANDAFLYQHGYRPGYFTSASLNPLPKGKKLKTHLFFLGNLPKVREEPFDLPVAPRSTEPRAIKKRKTTKNVTFGPVSVVSFSSDTVGPFTPNHGNIPSYTRTKEEDDDDNKENIDPSGPIKLGKRCLIL